MSAARYLYRSQHSERAVRRERARQYTELVNYAYAAVLTARDLRRMGRLDEAREMSTRADGAITKMGELR